MRVSALLILFLLTGCFSTNEEYFTMPIVPAARPTVQVRPLDIPFQSTAGVTPGAFGAAQGQALSGLGAGLAQVGGVLADKINVEQDKTNKGRGKELDITFTQGQRKLYTDWLALGGRAGVDAVPELKAEIEKLRDEVGATADNDEQREMFSITSGGRINTTFFNIDKQAVAKEQDARIMASTARTGEAIADAAVGADDPNVILRSEFVIKDEAEKMAELKGFAIDSEFTERLVKEGLTALYRTVIVTMIKNSQLSQAKEFLSGHRGEMDAPIAAEMSALLKGSDALADIQDASDDIWTVQSLRGAEALKAARAIEDPEVRKGVVNDINNRIAEDAKIARAAVGAKSSEIIEWIGQGGTYNTFAAIDPEGAALVAGRGDLLAAYTLRERAFSDGRRFAVASNGRTLIELRSLPLIERAAINPDEWNSLLTQSEAAKVPAIVASARAEMDRNSKSFAVYSRGLKVLEEAAKFKGLKWDEKEEGRNLRLQNLLSSQMGEFINSFTEVGEKPTNDDLVKEADRLLTEIDLPQAGFWDLYDIVIGDKTLAADVASWDKNDPRRANLRVDIEDVDPDVLELARQRLKENNVRITTDILEQFLGAERTNDFERQNRILGLDRPEGGFPAPRRVPFAETSSRTVPLAESLAAVKSEAIPRVAPATSVVEEAPVVIEEGLEDNPELIEALVLHEDIRKTRYFDTKGNPTIGVGFNLSRPDAKQIIESVGADFKKVLAGKEDLTLDQINQILKINITSAVKDARRNFAGFDDLSPARQMAVVDLTFNMGAVGFFGGFENTVKELEAGLFDKAADRLEKSDWFKSAGKRGPAIVKMIRDG